MTRQRGETTSAATVTLDERLLFSHTSRTAPILGPFSPLWNFFCHGGKWTRFVARGRRKRPASATCLISRISTSLLHSRPDLFSLSEEAHPAPKCATQWDPEAQPLRAHAPPAWRWTGVPNGLGFRAPTLQVAVHTLRQAHSLANKMVPALGSGLYAHGKSFQGQACRH
jgi:hypothetical protein